MTFLGWMHRKLMHNSTEPTKNSIIGNPCACFTVQTLYDEQIYYIQPTKTLRSKTNFHVSSNRFESDEVEGLFQEESFEPFEFLAIGTFGKELQSTDPPTPTLPVSSENNQIEITENDLELINYELEKFLEGEEKEIVNDTSERSSVASIITLSNKPIEGADSDGEAYFTVFPLQNYLFAASIEVDETNFEIKKEKASLEELIIRKNIAHDDQNRESKRKEQHSRKRNVSYFMKKVVKKFHSADSKDEATLPTLMKKKFSKALKMLKRKVHPECMTNTNISNKDVSKTEVDDGNKRVGPATTKRTEKNTKKLSSDDICEAASPINEGRWIKTDSDYLVLEL